MLSCSLQMVIIPHVDPDLKNKHRFLVFTNTSKGETHHNLFNVNITNILEKPACIYDHV